MSVIIKSKAYEECMSHVQVSALEDREPVVIRGVSEVMRATVEEVARYFPELKNTRIYWVERSLAMTMMARPEIWSLLFLPFRRYLILVNKNPSEGNLLLHQIPLDAQKGIISHELCHILDYEFKSRWEIFKTGFIYLFPKWKELYEKSTDYLAIKKGFGENLRAWSQFVLQDAKVNDKYRKVKEKYYLHPKEISAIDKMIRSYNEK